MPRRGFDVVTIAPREDLEPSGGARSGRSAVTDMSQPVPGDRYVWAAATSVICTAVAWVMYPGADDYVTKPFSAAELVARVRAALRRGVSCPEPGSAVRIGAAEVDLARREARGPHGAIHLTPLEYRVLESLVRHAGMIVRQDQLVREAWGPGRVGDTGSLRVCIKNLRAKLEPDPRRPRFLVTEAGLGYRFRSEDAADAD